MKNNQVCDKAQRWQETTEKQTRQVDLISVSYYLMIKAEENEYWQKATDKEKYSLWRNETWEYVNKVEFYF